MISDAELDEIKRIAEEIESAYQLYGDELEEDDFELYLDIPDYMTILHALRELITIKEG